MVENIELTINTIYKCLIKKKVVPKLRQEVKMKVDIVTSDDIKILLHSEIPGFHCYIIKKFLLLGKAKHIFMTLKAM